MAEPVPILIIKFFILFCVFTVVTETIFFTLEL
jgi:hypothetical protein